MKDRRVIAGKATDAIGLATRPASPGTSAVSRFFPSGSPLKRA